MPFTLMVEDISKPQAKGPDLASGNLNVFAMPKLNPRNLIFMGGHEINDAPTYDTVEAETTTDRGLDPISGRHIETVRRIGPSRVRGIGWNIVTPTKLITQVEEVRKKQERGSRYNLVLMPYVNCKPEEAFAFIGDDMLLDDWQFTTAVVGWGDNSAPISRQYVANTSGQVKMQLGLTFTELQAALGDDLYVVGRIEDSCAIEPGGCPHQIAFVAGGSPNPGGGGSASAVATVTKNQFGSDTDIDISAIASADMLITSGVYFNGNYVFGLSNNVGTSGTSGGFAYSAGGAPAVVVSGISADGVNAIVPVGTNIYAFGNSGEVWKSTNNGVSWTKITSGISEDILAADYDNETGVIYLACTGAKAYAYDLSTFTDLAGANRITPTAATALTAVAVLAPNHVAFGGADGKFYESARADTTPFEVTQTFGSNIGAIKGDGLGTRVVVGVGATVRVRDVVNRQEWVTVNETLTGNITCIEVGDQVTGETMNFFWIVTDTGEIGKLDTYYECVAD